MRALSFYSTLLSSSFLTEALTASVTLKFKGRQKIMLRLWSE
jgi:hypothetical protein